MDLIDQLMSGAAGRAASLGRPLVTLSYAQSLDGSLSARRGEGLAISCPETKLLTHQLRAANAGILVGIGTVLADDPSLGARLVGGPHPQPVILDRMLRIPLEARLLKRKELPPWLFCGSDAPDENQLALERTGARVFRVSADVTGCLDLPEVLKKLAEKEIPSLMVEGGGKVITSFLRAGLADQAMLTIAPVWIGGMASVNEALVRRSMVYPALREVQFRQVGRDVVIWGKIGEETYESSGPMFYGPTGG
jgi:GTP cyclohydrolase II